MNNPVVVSGKVFQGANKAAFFTQLPWVMEQCREKFGFAPFPGTLNLEIESADIERLEALPDKEWKDLVPPDENFCSSRVLPVWIGPVKGVLIRPDDHVAIHGRHIMEILAPVRLRDVLALADGDRVEIRLSTRLEDSPPRIYSLIDLEAVIFDLDGTLIDSIESYYRIVEIALERLGLPKVPRSKILKAAQNDSFQWEEILLAAPGKTLEETRTEAWKIIEAVYPELFLKNVRPFSDTGSVLRLLSACNIRIGIVTSTPEKNIKDKMKILDQAGVAGLMEVVICAGDAARKKPHPDPLILCCEKMGLQGSVCAYVGDTTIDMAAGKAAGMKTIGVLTGFDNHEDLFLKNPDCIIDSISDLPRVVKLYG
ncbi:MAG: HAD-IA family hydrolase [Desulfobacula sp.]